MTNSVSETNPQSRIESKLKKIFWKKEIKEVPNFELSTEPPSPQQMTDEEIKRKAGEEYLKNPNLTQEEWEDFLRLFEKHGNLNKDEIKKMIIYDLKKGGFTDEEAEEYIRLMYEGNRTIEEDKQFEELKQKCNTKSSNKPSV